MWKEQPRTTQGNKLIHVVYEWIQANLYRSHNDFRFHGQRLNSTLLFSIFAYLLRENVLLLGEYGAGKTTIAEILGSILGGFPLSAIVQAEVRASPDITEEKIIARVDIGELNQGIEKVIWSTFVKSPVHIVDELPRMPEIRQSLLLEGVRTGVWVYLGQILRTPRSTLFATANWEEFGSGSFDLSPALRDRFAVAVEAGYPGPRIGLEITRFRAEEKARELGLEYSAREAMRLLAAPYDPDALNAFSDDFKANLSKQRIPTLPREKWKAAEQEIRAMQLTDEANLFLQVMISSLNFCALTGEKRSARFGTGVTRRDCPADCRFVDTACSRIVSGGSRRKERAIRAMAQALAWFVSDSAVQVEHLLAVAPFCLWHRSTFGYSFLSSLRHEPRTTPLQLEAARRWVTQLYEEFEDRRDIFLEAIRYIDSHPDEAAKGQVVISEKIQTIDKLPHPFLIDYIRHSKQGAPYLFEFEEVEVNG